MLGLIVINIDLGFTLIILLVFREATTLKIIYSRVLK